MINCPACSPFLKKGINGHLTALCLAEASIHQGYHLLIVGKPLLFRCTCAHLQDVTAEGPCFCIVPCRSAPLSFWSRCRTLPSPRGGLVAFAICLCLRAGPPPPREQKKKQPGSDSRTDQKITPPPKKKKNQSQGPDPCTAKKKEKKGGVVESTLAFVPAFVLLCTVLMIKTRFFACGIRSLLTRELVYGSMQGITTLLAWRTSSSLSILAFGLMLIGVVHVLRLPAYGPMYIVFRLLPLMFVWVLLFWFCLAFFGLLVWQLALVRLLLVSFIGDCDHPVARACRRKKWVGLGKKRWRRKIEKTRRRESSSSSSDPSEQIPPSHYFDTVTTWDFWTHVQRSPLGFCLGVVLCFVLWLFLAWWWFDARDWFFPHSFLK